MITRPFNFEAHLKKPGGGPVVIPYVNVCLLFLFFTLLSSKFVLAPGVSLSLPTAKAADSSALPTYKVLTVGEVQGSERLIFEDRILNLDSFEKELPTLLKAKEARETVLLVRMDKGVSVQTLVRVCEIAREAGFREVRIATETQNAAPDSF